MRAAFAPLSRPGGNIARRTITRFARAREGAAAVEFALIATPFIFLLMAIIELALFFFASTIIENAAVDAARHIRTGEVQTTGQNEAGFRETICGRIALIADCARLSVDVRTLDSFSGAQLDAPLGEGGELNTQGFVFQPGGPGDVIMVRVFYDWQLFAPGSMNGMANLPGNRRLIAAATAFRNEPFPGAGS